jgi:predicted dehydrogenase/uncharacterized protein (DUF362 family)
VKVGVVGCGKIATSVHMPSISKIQGYDLVAASDLNPARLEEVKRKFDLNETYDDYNKMLAKADVEAVFVCTPPQGHFKIVLDSVEAGKHVLCEKPLSLTVEQGLTIKKTHEKLQRTGEEPLFVMPAHNFIFTPSFTEALKLVENGEIGKIKKVDACISSNLQFYGAKTDFRIQAKCGVLEDLLPHLIYLAHRVGGPLEKVSCIEPQLKSGIVSDVRVNTSLDHGIEANLTAKWTGLVPSLRLDLTGEDGKIGMDLLRTPYNLSVTKKDETKTIGMGRRVLQYIDVIRSKHPSYTNEHIHFLNCAEGKAQPLVSLDDGIELVRTLNEVTECFQGNTCATTVESANVAVFRVDQNNVETTVQKSIDILGGLNVKKDDTIVVKPNVCFPNNFEDKIITNPRVLEAVLHIAKRKSKNVLVVESDAASGTAEKRLTNTGVMDVIKRCDAEFINLSKDSTEQHKVADLTIEIPKTVLEADYFINLPKFKTNNFVGLSIAMKNMFGVIASRKKSYLHSCLAEVLVYLNQAVHQDLIITDGIIAMEGLGPILGKRVDLGLIVSGCNAVTVDAACCHIAGLNPYGMQPLWKAHQQGMGEIDVQKIQFLGDDVTNLKMKFSRPVLSKATITEALRTELRTRFQR